MSLKDGSASGRWEEKSYTVDGLLGLQDFTIHIKQDDELKIFVNREENAEGDI